MDLLFLTLALLCLAVMETIQHHFYESIFAEIKSDLWWKFFESDWVAHWHKNEHGEITVRRTGIDYAISLIDGYHVSKWLMIIFFILAGYFQMVETNVIWFGQLVLYSTLIYLIHRLTYGYFFLAKENRKKLLPF